MRGTIICICLLLLAPAFLHAEEAVPQLAFGSQEAPAVCPASQVGEAKSLSTSENWCGAPCSPNGIFDECTGYNACGWLQIDSCRCFNGRWLCNWSC